MANYPNPSCTHHIMVLHGWTWDFRRTNTCYSASLHIHWDETKFHHLIEHVWGWVLQHTYPEFTTHYLQFCILTCTPEFVNHGCLICMQMQQFFSYLVVITQTTHCYESCTKDFLTDASNLAPNLSCFSSACIFYMFSYYLKFNLLLEIFSLACKFFPACSWHIRKFSFEFETTHLIAIVAHLVYISEINPYSTCRWDAWTSHSLQ
jgi:hypothetical protein